MAARKRSPSSAGRYFPREPTVWPVTLMYIRSSQPYSQYIHDILDFQKMIGHVPGLGFKIRYSFQILRVVRDRNGSAAGNCHPVTQGHEAGLSRANGG